VTVVNVVKGSLTAGKTAWIAEDSGVVGMEAANQ